MKKVSGKPQVIRKTYYTKQGLRSDAERFETCPRCGSHSIRVLSRYKQYCSDCCLITVWSVKYGTRFYELYITGTEREIELRKSN